MQNKDQRPRVTVEDLLRLKRAERPTPEFWAGFERELRQKQLAALVERRPWWQEVPRWAARHVYLPMGAAAAMAFAFVTLRNEESSPQALGETIQAGVEHVAASTVSPAPVEELPASAPQPALPEPVSVESASAVIAATVPGNVGEMIPWSAPPTVDTPSSRSIAENLARLEQTEPELLEPIRNNRLVAAVARAQPTPERAHMELASVSLETSAPRPSNRLLAGFEQRELAPEPAAPQQVRDRIARRLADQDLLDQVRRLDLKGDRLSLKL